MRKRKASCSERRGLSIGESSLQDVHRRVDDDPHNVDEVPVDARYLDAAVLLRTEVPSVRAYDRVQEQVEADEHVRAVEAGEPVEDRALGGVLGREADVHVLVD